MDAYFAEIKRQPEGDWVGIQESTVKGGAENQKTEAEPFVEDSPKKSGSLPTSPARDNAEGAEAAAAAGPGIVPCSGAGKLLEEKHSENDGVNNESADVSTPQRSMPSSKRGWLTIYQQEENASFNFNNKDYIHALGNLQKLDKMRPQQLRTLLMIAECQMLVGRKEAALKTVEGINSLMSNLCEAECYELIQLADLCARKSYYCRAVMLLHCASFHHTPGHDWEIFKKCLEAIDKVSGEALGDGSTLDKLTQDSFAELIVALAPQIGGILEKIKGNNDAEVEVRARYFGNLADCLLWLDRLKESLELYKKGIKEMEKCFGESHCMTLKIYEECLHKVGYIKLKMGKFEKAKKYLTDAHAAAHKANDYGSEKERNEALQRTKKRLDEIKNSNEEKDWMKKFFVR